MDGCEGVGGCGCVIWVEHDIAAGAHELEEIFHPGGLGFADFLDVFGGLGGHCGDTMREEGMKFDPGFAEVEGRVAAGGLPLERGGCVRLAFGMGRIEGVAAVQVGGG